MRQSASVTSNRPKARTPLFASAKAVRPIPVESAMRMDALIQAALDPEVFTIDYVPGVLVKGVEFLLRGIVLAGETGRTLLDLPDDGPTPDVDQVGLLLLAAESLGLPIVTRTAEELRANPFAENCMLVWRSRSHRIHPGDQVRVLQHLEENEPCRLIDVAGVVRSSPDGVSAVLALACQDLLELDLRLAPLGPWTTTRRRRQHDGI